ncbi:MAG: protein kinase, partial [Gammaproteobacteria bacterium]|nr:protein kinase [Gammaproteobacteria bacterium]
MEARAETPLESWPAWEGQVVNGLYPLRRVLGASDHSVVFLTECKAHGVASAAIKIIPVERVALGQLARWRSAAGISHPHLVPLFDAGLCQLGGRQFLFVVMAYAEQVLVQLLQNRPLTADEARQLLAPVLTVLTFLHEKNLVHGQLKPANILVVDDQLRLASDTIRPAGEPRTIFSEHGIYDAPGSASMPTSAADDIWALGITLIEALTQRAPDPAGALAPPATVAPDLASLVQRCLNRDPALRPTAGGLHAALEDGLQPAEVAKPLAPRALPAESAGSAPDAVPSPERSLTPLIVTMAMVLLLAGWAGLRRWRTHPSPPATTAAAVTPAPPAAPSPPAAAQNPPAATSSAVAQGSDAQFRERAPAPPRIAAR